MALKRYRVEVGGVDTILKLTEAEAEKAGLTEYRKVHTKGRGAQNRARGADNKQRSAQTKTEPAKPVGE